MQQQNNHSFNLTINKKHEEKECCWETSQLSWFSTWEKREREGEWKWKRLNYNLVFDSRIKKDIILNLEKEEK